MKTTHHFDPWWWFSGHKDHNSGLVHGGEVERNGPFIQICNAASQMAAEIWEQTGLGIRSHLIEMRIVRWFQRMQEFHQRSPWPIFHLSWEEGALPTSWPKGYLCIHPQTSCSDVCMFVTCPEPERVEWYKNWSHLCRLWIKSAHGHLRDGHKPGNGSSSWILVHGATWTMNLHIYQTGSFCAVHDAVEWASCRLETPNSQRVSSWPLPALKQNKLAYLCACSIHTTSSCSWSPSPCSKLKWFSPPTNGCMEACWPFPHHFPSDWGTWTCSFILPYVL